MPPRRLFGVSLYLVGMWVILYRPAGWLWAVLANIGGMLVFYAAGEVTFGRDTKK